MALRHLRELALSPLEVMGNLRRYRHILVQMVLQEIKGRFAGSLGGLFWNFVHPILMFVIYLVVFVYIFKLRVGAGGGTGASVIYLMSGIFPWMIIAEGFARGTHSLVENAGLIQKTSFPTEILTAKGVLAPLVSHGIVLVCLALYCTAATRSPLILVLLPLLVVLQTLLVLGLAFLAASFSVFFRDVLQLVQVFISVWIYVTPIFYPLEMLPGWAARLMYANPLFPLMSSYQSLFLSGSVPRWDMILLAAAWAVGFYAAGAFVFTKLKYEFADWL